MTGHNRIRTNPQDILKFGWQQLESGKLQAAVSTCQSLNANSPQLAEGWALSSQVALRLGNADKSLTFIERALVLQPDEAPLYLFKAQAQLAQKRLPEAINNAQRSAQLAPNDPLSQNNAATFISLHCRDHPQALPYFRQAVTLDPNNAQYRFNLAAVLRFVGDLDEAEQQLDGVIEQQSDYGEAWLIRSDLRKQRPDRNHRSSLEAQLNASATTSKNDVHLCYALAKECEDLKEYEAAFDALQQGADLRRNNIRYDVQQDIDTIDALIENFTPEWWSLPKNSCSSDEPIFIVGLPRTGTTLVERILSSHDDVFAAGELNDFALAMVNLAQQQAGSQLSRDKMIEMSTQLNFEHLGQRYIENTRPFTGHSPHFIDKLPLNFLYCGLIARALPKAKIIHVQRVPMDSCYAMYKRLFKQAYPMSYDLDELGRYYLAYRRLMAHWKQLMPGVIHEIQYEDLVNNQEAETRRLLNFCGLNWQDKVLKFERNPEASTTASASQVRQPIYRSSMQQWRYYEKQLTPLITRLREGGVEIE